MMNDKPDINVESKETRALGRGEANLKERQVRQAQSLRDNLKKRKKQVRSRDDETGQEP